jgi:hypothetical protein
LEGNQCVVVVLIVAVGLLILIAQRIRAKEKRNRAKGKRIEQAEEAYKAGLTKLRKDPGNVQFRQWALELGRAFAREARSSGGETLFDEVALMNDLNAITPTSSGKASEQQSHPAGVEDRLRRLESLRQEGLISVDEYSARRKSILDEI